jgi:hypothetical protein
MRFDEREQSQSVTVDIGGDQKTAPVVMNNGTGKPTSEKCPVDKNSMGYNPSQQSIDLVSQQVTSRRALTITNLHISLETISQRDDIFNGTQH